MVLQKPLKLVKGIFFLNYTENVICIDPLHALMLTLVCDKLQKKQQVCQQHVQTHNPLLPLSTSPTVSP